MTPTINSTASRESIRNYEVDTTAKATNDATELHHVQQLHRSRISSSNVSGQPNDFNAGEDADDNAGNEMVRVCKYL